MRYPYFNAYFIHQSLQILFENIVSGGVTATAIHQQ